MTLLSSLFKLGSGRTQKQRLALLDLLLMTAQADGPLSLSERDRIARAIEAYEELRGTSWDEVLERANEILGDAPLFSETRDRVRDELENRELRRFAVALAAQCASLPLTDEERALLGSVAEGFGIDEHDAANLMKPWMRADPAALGYRRTRYNDLDRAAPPSWAAALARASDGELELLLFKATATRTLLTRLGEDAQLVAFGDTLTTSRGELRVDALVEVGSRRVLARFLARGEAMFPEEPRAWIEALDGLDGDVSLCVGYADAVPLPDQSALRAAAGAPITFEKLG